MKVCALFVLLAIVGVCYCKPNPNLDENRKLIPSLRSSLSHITELSKKIKAQKDTLAMDRSDNPSLEHLEAEVRQLEAEETMLKTRNTLMSILRPHNEKPKTVHVHTN